MLLEGWRKRKLQGIAGHFTGNAESIVANLDDGHYGYGVKNKERGKFPEFCLAMILTATTINFKKRVII